MLCRLSVKGRMFLLIGSIMFLFVVMGGLAIRNVVQVNEASIARMGDVMLADQKEKLHVASHTIAIAVGHAIADVKDPDERIAIIRQMVDDIRFEEDESGYYFVYDGTVVVALPPKKELQGTDMAEKADRNGVLFVPELQDQAKAGGGFVEYVWPKPGMGDVPKIGYAEMIPGTNMWIGTGVYLDNIAAYQASMREANHAQLKSNTIKMAVISGGIFIGVLSLCLLIALGFVRTLRQLSEKFEDISEGDGDLTKRIAIKSKDEFSELANRFNTFMAKLHGIVVTISENTVHLGGEAQSLSNIAIKLSASAKDTSCRSNSVASAAEEMSTNLQNVAAAIEQSDLNVRMVASAAEEMTTTISEIAKNTSQANQISGKAVSQAEATTKQMARLKDSATAIDQVTETITEISEQINLLALNATIEAARSGEAGKGFAVVAGEIKQLAKLTADATLDIKSRIGEVQETTDATTGEIHAITEIVNEVNQIVATISLSVNEQSKAGEEIASNISQAASGLTEVNHSVREISTVAASITQDIAVVNEASSKFNENSSQVDNSSGGVRSFSEQLRIAVASFKV